MYYLYKKAKRVELPKFRFMFKSFDEFYEIADLIDVPLFGIYNINIKSEDFKAIINFIDHEKMYSNLAVYIETSDSLLKYLQLNKPNVSLINSKSNYEVFKELISKHEILFDVKVIDKLYFAIGHEYEEMEEALIQIKTTFPDVSPITEKHISELFVIDNNTYPRSVLISFLRMDRFRWSRFNRAFDAFGNDIMFYSMRKTARKFLQEKIKYLKSGQGTWAAKNIPIRNIILMVRCLEYENRGFKDIRTLLSLYEKGETIYDFISGETVSFTDAERDVIG